MTRTVNGIPAPGLVPAWLYCSLSAAPRRSHDGVMVLTIWHARPNAELQDTCAIVLVCFDVVWSSGLTQPSRNCPGLPSPSDNHSAKSSLRCWLPIYAKINCFTPWSWKFLLALVKKRKYKNIPSWIPRTEINISWLSRYSTAFAGLKGWLIHTLYTYKSYFGKSVSNICLEIPN